MNYKSLLSACVGLLAMTPAALAVAPYDYAVGDDVTCNYVTYTVTGENLFTNPSFDDGKEGWINGKEEALGSEFEVVATGGADGGAYLKSLADGGSGTTAALRAYIELTPGKTYVFSVFGKNIGDWKRLCLNSVPSTTGCKDNIVQMSGGDEWTQSLGVFTAGENDKYAVFQGGWCASKACFDCFFLAEVEVKSELERPVLFEESKPYYLYNEKSGAYLSAKDGWITLQEFEAEEYGQVFSFESTPADAATEGHNILSWTGEYIFQGSSAWDTCVGASADPKNNKAIFVVDGEPDNITLKVVSSKFMGADNFSAGDGVYLDKSGDKTLYFKLIEAEATPDLTILETILDEVITFIDGVEVGDEAGMYPEEAYDELFAALEAADECYDATSQREVMEGAAALKAAFADFKAQVNVAEFDVKHGIYRLVHAASGAYFYTGWHENANCAIYIGGEFRTDYKGEFEIEALSTREAKAYTLKSEDGYLVNNNNSLGFTATLPEDDSAKFTFTDAGNGIAIGSVASGKYVGPQWGNYYSWVHGVADHAGDNGQHLFNLELVKDLEETTGVEGVADADIAIRALDGAVAVSGAENVAVYTVAGVAVAEAQGNDVTIALSAGTYIVRADSTARVFIVK